MMRQLDRFGDDSKNLIVKDHYAMGYQSHWSVPEEIGEQQPLDLGDQRWFFFYGRVDNRQQLFNDLELRAVRAVSDAQLVSKYFTAFGEQGLENIIGPFVLVEFDSSRNSVFMARDAMGARYLVYRQTEKFILISTYEMALVAHGSFGYEINEEKAARYLLNEMENVPSSLIVGVKPLNPGMRLRIDSQQSKLKRYYKYSAKTRIKLDSDKDYAQEFRRLLEQAVQRRLRSTGHIGSMLSGGLDSVPMTILAADQCLQSKQVLIAFSWVFDKYPNLDERSYSSPICQAQNIEQVMVNCDELWPGFDETMDLNPIIPFGIPFSEYQEETLRQAKNYGITTMLTGIHGDLLYEYTQEVLYELAQDGKVGLAVSEFARLWAGAKSKVQFIKQYLLRPLTVTKKVSERRRLNRRFSTEILTDQIAAKLQQREHWLKQESQNALRPQQWQVVLDGFAGDDAVHGRYLDAKHGVERRYPFRDRDLCEFMLAIPSQQLYFDLIKRPIVKNQF